MGMSRWSINGPPAPFISLVLIPMFVAFHILLVIAISLVVTFISKNDSMLPVFLGVVFLISAYLIRDIYLRLFFNLFVWLLKGNGRSLFDKILLRAFKYSLIVFVVTPLIILLVQLFLPNQYFNEVIWAGTIFKYYYLSGGLVLLTAYLVETYLPRNIRHKVEKVYSQRGGLMARVQW